MLVNSYLFWDEESREACLVDCGDGIESLIDTVIVKSLNLTYVLITHAHQDHISKSHFIKQMFPKVTFVIGKEELEDFPKYSKWEELYPSSSVTVWLRNEEYVSILEFDYESFPGRLLEIEGDTCIRLGNKRISIYKTPGHSRGSLSFYVDKYLFCGDLILYNATGYMNYPLGSKEDVTMSVRRLYSLFPDSTVLCSGHGERSLLGIEKRNNKHVSSTNTAWPIRKQTYQR
jgi:hydroxyacylglutathione hydrolase